MSKKEVVVCAAIHIKGRHVEPYERFMEPLECILAGSYYSEIRKDQSYKELRFIEVENEIEGFITNKNRFVSPEEALEITGLGAQLRFRDRKYLLPEDLY